MNKPLLPVKGYKDKSTINPSLIGRIVCICTNRNPEQHIVLQVTEIRLPPWPHSLGGYFIAGHSKSANGVTSNHNKPGENYTTSYILVIYGYKVITRRELPLYIGDRYTSPLLAEIIRGDHEPTG